jgi:FdhD protein
VPERFEGRRVRRHDGAQVAEAPDTLAVEEPLEIRLGQTPLTVTMRTPGDDIDLALGWLVAEGAIKGSADVVSVRERSQAMPEGLPARSVEIELAPGVTAPRARAFLTSSACGVCGADAIATIIGRASEDVGGDAWSSDALGSDDCVVSAEVLTGLPDQLRGQQSTFARTGGLHAAGLFSVTGDLVVAREDVGRHNAVDKVVGWALRHDRLPLRGTVLQVSGRASFELAAKAVAAGIPVLSAISAPSTLAVDLARDSGLTLAGFVRGQSFNVYAGDARIR